MPCHALKRITANINKPTNQRDSKAGTNQYIGCAAGCRDTTVELNGSVMLTTAFDTVSGMKMTAAAVGLKKRPTSCNSENGRRNLTDAENQRA
jgi:hypothetical protein